MKKNKIIIDLPAQKGGTAPIRVSEKTAAQLMEISIKTQLSVRQIADTIIRQAIENDLIEYRSEEQ